MVFETHALSVDNEQGVATGWLPGELSERGQAAAAALGRRRRGNGLAAVFSSDLRRAMQTAAIAFADVDIPLFVDWRLRECDYGRLNGAPTGDVPAAVDGICALPIRTERAGCRPFGA